MQRQFRVLCAALSLVVTTAFGVEGDPTAGQQKALVCSACHGLDGNAATNPEWPILAGQHPQYLAKQLHNYRAGGKDPDGADMVRMNAIMNGQAAGLSDQDIADLAAYFASQETKRTKGADPELVELGEALYRGGDLSSGIPACTGCHSPNGMGNAGAVFPMLAGQHATYTELQLKAFRSMQRANDPGRMMRNIAAKMSDRQIRAVASYIQGLRPTAVNFKVRPQLTAR